MNYIKIDECSVANGTGIRTVLWVTGCSHHCYNCQNPQTWDKTYGTTFNENTKREIINSLYSDYISGITYSGGDPLNDNNIDEIISLAKEIKIMFPNKTQWLYTGYTWEQITNDVKLSPILNYIDILVDGKYIDDLKDITLVWKGSSNQRVIDVKKSLLRKEVILFA